ncbi:MAG TPA: glucose PTS transporter subunit EIIB, partial [Psychromonas sp.]
MGIIGKLKKAGEARKDQKLKKTDRENEQKSGKTPPVSDAAGELAIQYVTALGGIDNLKVIYVCLTRLRLTLKDLSVVNEAELRALGAMGVVKQDENKLQVIVGPQAESIANALKAFKKRDSKNEQKSRKKPPVSDAAGELAIQYVTALGGIDNLKVIDVCLTRLRLTLKDLSVVNEAELRALGAMG